MKRHRLSHRIVSCIWFVSGIFPSIATGQAVSDPNQIEGEITLTTSNATILGILDMPGREGFSYGHMIADSVTTPSHPVQFNNFLDTQPTGRLSTTYEINVESGPVGDGIVYSVGVEMLMDGNTERYLFEPRLSLPVEQEPAPNVPLTFSEEVSLLHIRWMSSDGGPVPISAGQVHAYREQTPDSGTFALQAYAPSLQNGTEESYLAVRSGALYRVVVSAMIETGTDPSSDLITFHLPYEVYVTVAGDSIVPIDCVVPTDPVDLPVGEIVGQVDMLGEQENVSASDDRGTFIAAFYGPHGNHRYDELRFFPAAGPFRLENLLASSAVSPAKGYALAGEMSFRLGRRYQYLKLPELDGPINGRTTVNENEVTDLADMYVMDPGYVAGRILLMGPHSTQYGSLLEDVYRDADTDRDGDGIPDVHDLWYGSRVQACGVDALASGATKTTRGALARTSFVGDYQASRDVFLGTYELVLAGLRGEPSLWSNHSIFLRFRDTATPSSPETYHDAWHTIAHSSLGTIEVVPGETAAVDYRLCTSQVSIGFRATSGYFNDPVVMGTGVFQGVDFQGANASYTVSMLAHGTPTRTEQSAAGGMVVAAMLQGDYDLTPFVKVGGSTTELEPISISVGCRQVLRLTTDLQISLGALPGSGSSQTCPIAGSVASRGEVPRIYYQLNLEPEEDICVGCGENPSFATNLDITQCENDLKVAAVDLDGNEASVASSFRYDVPPVLSGCLDIETTSEPGGAGVAVDFGVTAADVCDGPLPVSYSIASGTVFPVGETTVAAAAVDTSGNLSECSFVVRVIDCEPVTPDVEGRSYWQNQCHLGHPGQEEDLNEYLACVGSSATFAGVAEVAALCEQLNPGSGNSTCKQAEAQLMALLLNLCSGRIRECNCISDADLGEVTVGEAATLADQLLANPARTQDDCQLAHHVAKRVNNGVSHVDCNQ